MDYASLRREFESPSNRYRIATLFRFNDALDAGHVEWQVHSLKEQGFGGLFLYLECLGGGAPFQLLSEEWFRAVELLASACVKEGLDFWIYDDQDWPSGILAGRLVRERPELAWKYLHLEEHTVRGPADFRLPAGEHTLVSAVAFRMKDEEIIENSLVDLTPPHDNLCPASGACAGAGGGAAGGTIQWRAPAGEWTVALYTMRPGVGGFMCGASADLMDPAAGEAFVERSYRANADFVAKLPGAKLKGFFTDEPTCSMALYSGWPKWADKVPPTALPWTPQFLEAFRRMHGYDARGRLSLMHHAGGDWRRFRAHFFQTCAELMREAYYAPIDRFCRERGLVATGHQNGEEAFHHHLAACGGDILTHYRHLHVPGIDWIVPFSVPLPAVTPKFAASVTHRMGLHQTLCESFAASGWGLTFQQMRWILNWENINGISLQVPICYKYSLRGRERTTFYGPGISYQQPYWDHFRTLADYEARLCALAAGGGHVAQVALYYPAADFAAHYNDKPFLERRSKAYSELGDVIRHAGYDFDIVDDEALLELAKVDGGRLRLGDETHEAIVLPRLETIRRATLERLLEFARGGGALLFTQALPRHSLEAGANDPRIAELVGQLLGEDVRAMSSGSEAFWRPCGRHGAVGYAPTNQAAVELLRGRVAPDVLAAPPAERIVALHRRLADGDLYLLYNHTDQAQTADLTLSAAGHPERWDPLTSEARGVANYRAGEGGGTVMTLPFAPHECIPLFLHAKASRAARPRCEKLVREIPIPGPFGFRMEETLRRPQVVWNFTPDMDGWKLAPPPAAPAEMPLGDWREQGLEHFSGIGHYTAEVDLGDLPASVRVELDLGRVAISAEVFVNGAGAGIVIFEPYRLDITQHIRAGRNEVHIAVANTLSNYYSQFAELAKAEVGAGNDFPERRTSGLLGPVTVRAYQ